MSRKFIISGGVALYAFLSIMLMVLFLAQNYGSISIFLVLGLVIMIVAGALIYGQAATSFIQYLYDWYMRVTSPPAIKQGFEFRLNGNSVVYGQTFELIDLYHICVKDSTSEQILEIADVKKLYRIWNFERQELDFGRIISDLRAKL